MQTASPYSPPLPTPFLTCGLQTQTHQDLIEAIIYDEYRELELKVLLDTDIHIL